MKNYMPSEEDISSRVDPFLAVMNKEYDGHRRLYGRSVTNKQIKKVSGGDKSYMVPSELEDEHERKKAEREDDHERKKAELEAIQKDIDNQRDKLVEDAVQKKLPHRIVQEFLT